MKGKFLLPGEELFSIISINHFLKQFLFLSTVSEILYYSTGILSTKEASAIFILRFLPFLPRMVIFKSILKASAN